MATKKMYRVLNTVLGKIELSDYSFLEYTIVLNEIDIEYDDTITPDMNDDLVEAIDKQIIKLGAKIALLDVQKATLLAIENKPIPDSKFEGPVVEVTQEEMDALLKDNE